MSCCCAWSCVRGFLVVLVGGAVAIKRTPCAIGAVGGAQVFWRNNWLVAHEQLRVVCWQGWTVKARVGKIVRRLARVEVCTRCVGNVVDGAHLAATRVSLPTFAENIVVLWLCNVCNLIRMWNSLLLYGTIVFVCCLCSCLRLVLPPTLSPSRRLVSPCLFYSSEGDSKWRERHDESHRTYSVRRHQFFWEQWQRAWLGPRGYPFNPESITCLPLILCWIVHNNEQEPRNLLWSHAYWNQQKKTNNRSNSRGAFERETKTRQFGAGVRQRQQRRR